MLISQTMGPAHWLLLPFFAVFLPNEPASCHERRPGDDATLRFDHTAWTDPMNEKKSPLEIAASLTDYWSPRVIGEVDDHYVKVAKLKGTLAWHDHSGEDEMFHVLDGQLQIEMRDRTVELTAGEIFIVPRGEQHNPVADEECLVMLFERKATRHTGDVTTDKTRSIDQQLA